MGSDGLDVLEEEGLPVSPEQVLFGDFRALETVALADLKAVQAGAAGGGFAGLQAVAGEQRPLAGAAVDLLNQASERNGFAAFQRAPDRFVVRGLLRPQEVAVFGEAAGLS